MIDKANPNPAFMGPFLHHDYYITSHVDALNSKNSGYWPLAQVLTAAYAQAADGKGSERHAMGDAFLDQPIITIGQMLKSADGDAYQAIKKLREGLQMAKRGEYDAAIREFLGAVNYVAAVAILIAEEQDTKGRADFYADALAEGLRFRKELQDDAPQKTGPVPMAEAVAKLKSLDSGVTTEDADDIAAAIITQTADTIMRRKQIEIGAPVPQKDADELQPVKPGIIHVPNEVCPAPGVQPTRDQYFVALLRYGPESIDFSIYARGALRDLGYDEALSREEIFSKMADLRAEYDKRTINGRCKVKTNTATIAVFRAVTEAMTEWRTDSFDDDEFE